MLEIFISCNSLNNFILFLYTMILCLPIFIYEILHWIWHVRVTTKDSFFRVAALPNAVIFSTIGSRKHIKFLILLHEIKVMQIMFICNPSWLFYNCVQFLTYHEDYRALMRCLWRIIFHRVYVPYFKPDWGIGLLCQKAW